MPDKTITTPPPCPTCSVPLHKRWNVWLGITMVLFAMILGDLNSYYLGRNSVWKIVLHEQEIDIP
jgi:membrane protein DedA with SNARE-associated domain